MSIFDNAQPMDWSNTVYGDDSEEIPGDAPIPLGDPVVLTHYFDANLLHNLVDGKSVTGCLHFINKTPIMWYSKKQNTIETATYGAEFSASSTCLEQVVDLRHTLRYLGVNVGPVSYVFGDNAAMITSSNFPILN